MFEIDLFGNVKKAAKFVQKLLSDRSKFNIVHSISGVECSEECTTADADIVLDYMRDLDAQNGYMALSRDGCWDFAEAEEPDKVDVHRPSNTDEIYVKAGEGVAVLHNAFAYQFPVIVVKKGFFEANTERVLEQLTDHTPGSDYTSKISPAVYLEV